MSTKKYASHRPIIALVDDTVGKGYESIIAVLESVLPRLTGGQKEYMGSQPFVCLSVCIN